MSLINEMLQDLDKRGAPVTGMLPMQGNIRVVAEKRGVPRYFYPLVLSGLLVVMAWAVWRFSPLNHVQKAPAPTAVAPVKENNRLAMPNQGGLRPVEKIDNALDLPVQLMLSDKLSKASLIAQATAVEEEKKKAEQTSDKLPIPKLSTLSEKSSLQLTVATETALAEVNSKPSKQMPELSALAMRKINDSASTLPVKAVKEVTPAQQADSDYRQALALQQQGHGAEAITLLEQGLRSYPAHAGMRQSLIAVLVETKRGDDAIRIAQQGLSQDLNQSALAMMLARLFVDKGDIPSAVDTLKASLPGARERADYLAFLAALQQRLGHHKEAIDLYQSALKRTPQSGLWWMGVGISLQADSRSADALEAYNRAKDTHTLSPELTAFVEQKIAQLLR